LALAGTGLWVRRSPAHAHQLRAGNLQASNAGAGDGAAAKD
jgi:hypothetical protein